MNFSKFFAFTSFCLFYGASAFAQGNYEIQVYGSELVDPKATMIELHSNYTFDEAPAPAGTTPALHTFHETIEITHGFNRWMEVGFYLFNSIGAGQGVQFVGSHIRPRITVPKEYGLPVGISLSLEAGIQNPAFGGDNATIEVRPIVDKTIGTWYFAFNPTLDRSLRGMNENQGWVFSPNLKVSDAVTKQIAPGLEYYGTLGPLAHLSQASQQIHQLYLTVDLHFNPKWELNAGYGTVLNSPSRISMGKIILGRRIGK